MDYFDASTHEKLLKSLELRATNLDIKNANRKKPVLGGVNPPISDDYYDKLFLKDGQPRPTGKTLGGHPIYTFGEMEFVKVPAGEFWMGSNDGQEREKPEHLVYLDHDFYIGRYPVTNRQYARIIGSVSAGREKINHPVVNISWRDAQEFIERMNERYQDALPNSWMFRLPSEAEWEKAARGESGYLYPWGDEFDITKCNTKENDMGASGAGTTTSVGEYSPHGDSPYGCADMAGNVYEWTRSIYSEDFKYPYRFDDGREYEWVEKEHRVLRGGAFNGYPYLVLCSFRSSNDPLYQFDYYGFRVAVVPVPSA